MKRRSEITTRGLNELSINRKFKAYAVRDKRVKCTESEVDPSSHNEPTAFSKQHEEAGLRRSDAPKTSEYAFFKKLKKDAGCSGSSVLREGGEQLKIFEPSGSNKDFTTKFKDDFEKIRSSIYLEKARVNSHNVFSPPQANTPKNLETAQVVENSHNDIRSPFLARTVKFSNQNLLLSPLGDASEKSVSEDVDEDMFSQKRKRLRQWVAETSVPEVENLHLKGYDLVSVLLNRLFPDRDQSKHCRDTEATPIKTDAKYSAREFLYEDTYGENWRTSRTRDFVDAEPLSYLDDFCNMPREMISLKLDSSLLNSPSSSQYLQNNFFCDDNYNEKSHWTKSRDCIETDSVRYLDDSFNKTRNMIPFNLDTRICNSPSVGHTRFQYGDNNSYLSCDDRSKSFFSLRDPYFCSDLEVYESSTLSQIERNEFLSADESDYEKGSDTLLLGWDFAKSQGKGYLSHTTCDKGMDLVSTLVAPWYDRHLSLCNSFGINDARSISSDSDCRFLYPYRHFEKNSNWHSRLSEEGNLLVTELKQYPLPLPYFPKCIDISEDADTDTLNVVDDGIALQRNEWVISNIFNEKHHSDSFKPLFPSGSYLDTYGKCLSSRELQSPHKESIFSFLLTDEQEAFLYSSKDRQSGSLYTEDTINIHKWLAD